MKINFARYRKFFIAFAILSAIILYLFYNALKPVKILPVYQPAEVSFELVDSTLQHVKKYIKLLPFVYLIKTGK